MTRQATSQASPQVGLEVLVVVPLEAIVCNFRPFTIQATHRATSQVRRQAALEASAVALQLPLKGPHRTIQVTHRATFLVRHQAALEVSAGALQRPPKAPHRTTQVTRQVTYLAKLRVVTEVLVVDHQPHPIARHRTIEAIHQVMCQVNRQADLVEV